jgi:ABC-type antimicrobial peptide transport system ATPase subunit
MTYIFIARNLSVVKHIGDNHVVLIHVGKLVGTSNTQRYSTFPNNPTQRYS